MTNWRAMVKAAIADGDAAEAKISARDLAALLKLPADERLRDPRVAGLLPAELERLRKSLSGEMQDDRNALITRQRQVLSKYIAGYIQALKAEAPSLTEALTYFFHDPVAAATGIVDDMIAKPPPPIEQYEIGRFGRMRWRWRPSHDRRWAAHVALQQAARISHALHAARSDLAVLSRKE